MSTVSGTLRPGRPGVCRRGVRRRGAPVVASAAWPDPGGEADGDPDWEAAAAGLPVLLVLLVPVMG
ncbi:hypothetical protein [Streptomyces niveus]|uniref:hypothetical protein n=1 Tax=Streptomyces niveus TaxID=193462 RepID=UPI0035DEC476